MITTQLIIPPLQRPTKNQKNSGRYLIVFDAFEKRLAWLVVECFRYLVHGSNLVACDVFVGRKRQVGIRFSPDRCS